MSGHGGTPGGEAAEVGDVGRHRSRRAGGGATTAVIQAGEYQGRLVRTITDNATSALFMMDAYGRCLFMNPAAEKMIGYRLDEINDQPLHDVIHHHYPDGRPFPIHECPIDRALPEKNGFRGHRDIFIRKNGEFFPVECAALPIMEGDTPVGTVIEVRDITEQARAEQEIRDLTASLERRVAERTAQLQALTAEQETFVYTVSHDLRAPLLAIQGMAELLPEAVRAGDASEAAFLAGRVVENVTRMNRLLDDLLSLSRVGRTDDEAVELDLGNVARSVLTDLEPRLRQRAATVHLPPQWPHVRLPQPEAEQVLTNLLSNAIKYGGRPGEPPRAAMRWSRHGEQVVVQVDDNGPGVPAPYREKVFGLFARLNPKEEGTGVGLAIVRRIAERHGGRAWVEESDLGGASFRVSLPSPILAD